MDSDHFALNTDCPGNFRSFYLFSLQDGRPLTISLEATVVPEPAGLIIFMMLAAVSALSQNRLR
jgi:hypothetical protein